MPASYALEALQQVGAHRSSPAIAVRDIAVVIGFAVVALCLAAATLRRQDPMSVTATKPDADGPGRPRRALRTPVADPDSARNCSPATGFDNTSIRAVATAAGVDPALVHHYFGTKEQLFAAAIHIPIDPMEIIGPMRERRSSSSATRCRRVLLPLWDSELGKGFIATLRSLLAGSEVGLLPIVSAGRHRGRGRHPRRRSTGRASSGCSSSRRNWWASWWRATSWSWSRSSRCRSSRSRETIGPEPAALPDR